MGSGAGAKKLASTTSMSSGMKVGLKEKSKGVIEGKEIDMKPKEADGDDDWGDAWD